MNRLKRNVSTLKLLEKASPSLRKAILKKASPELIHTICECALNILRSNVPLTNHCKRRLSRHKEKLRKLADKKVSLKTKKSIIQKGGFLPILISALAPVFGKILGALTS